MEEVFRNLLSNAIKFSEDEINPRIKIGGTDQGSEYHFYVRDNGCGIEPEVQKKLFTLFFRHGEKAGTGVGLSIVKQYIELHRGRVWVESQPGTGSTFWFSLPK